MTAAIHPEDDERAPPEKFSKYFDFLRSEWNTFVWLFQEFSTPQSRYHLRRMLVLLVLSILLLTAQPGIIAKCINAVSSHSAPGILISLTVLALCAALQHFVSFKEGSEREWVLGLHLCRLDERISELLLTKPLGQQERHGSALNYASIDKGKWKTVALCDMIIFQGIPAAITCVLALVGLWYVKPEFGALATLFGVLFYTWSLWLNHHIGKAMHPVEREFRRINRVRVERWEKAARVLTNGKARKDIRNLSVAMDTTMEEDRIFWIWFILQYNVRGFLIQRMLVLLALTYGSYLVYHGWEIGYLFPLVMWAETLNNQLLNLAHVERQIGRDIVPIQLMNEALRITPSFNVDAGVPLERNGPLSVRFNNVSYGYTDEHGKEHPVLRDISLGIARGEKVALLGPSGAGKTTLMKLLLRYDDPTKGVILLNNKPLKRFELASYMQQVGYIPQTSMIFDSTLGENLLYGVGRKRRDQLLADDSAGLWQMMRSLKIDFGSRLDRGLDTLVGQHGLKLSGGQAQRVMIGAAVAKNPRLMVIDEATSSLDSTTEREVQQGLAAALAQGTTALIVAHRLSTVRDLCDRFVVLRPIEDLAQGESQIEAVACSFEELAEISPTFRQLAHDQGVSVQ